MVLSLRLAKNEYIRWLEQGLAAARLLKDRRGEGSALGNLGSAYAGLGQPHKAIEFYEQHLAIAREIGDRRGEGNALGNLGAAYARWDGAMARPLWGAKGKKAKKNATTQADE